MAANSSALRGERAGFLLSEVDLPRKRAGFLLSEVDLPRFGVLAPRIIRSLARVKAPITSIIRTFLELAQYVRATPPGVLRRKDSALVAICR